MGGPSAWPLFRMGGSPPSLSKRLIMVITSRSGLRRLAVAVTPSPEKS